MEKLKQRLSKNSTIENVLNDRPIDDQEQELADDTDAFTSSASSELEVDISLRLKLSESSNSVHEKSSFII